MHADSTTTLLKPVDCKEEFRVLSKEPSEASDLPEYWRCCWLPGGPGHIGVRPYPSSWP